MSTLLRAGVLALLGCLLGFLLGCLPFLGFGPAVVDAVVTRESSENLLIVYELQSSIRLLDCRT